MPIVDAHNRPLRNLRVSVTDRCNLRCQYCMPEADYLWLPREDILQFEEIDRLVDQFVALGVDKVRLTGGEPLLRRDLPSLIERLSAKSAIKDLAMTTNAVLLGNAVCGMSNRNSGQFFCLDAKSGKTQWLSEPRQATNAAVLGAGKVWFALKDDAELLVMRADASGFEPVRRYSVADSATWAQPTISGNRIFVKDVSNLTLWVIE